MASTAPKRRDFQQSFEMTRLSDGPISPSGAPTQRFISHQPAWLPGGDLSWKPPARRNKPRSRTGPGAFGGHVYAQAALAAARGVEEEDKEQAPSNGQGRRSIHSIQGVFTHPGLTDRPFLYDVSTISSSRSFSTRLINARQPSEPSSNPSGPFPLADQHLPMGDVCFTCIVTFKRPVPPPSDIQESQSPQQRFASILSLRKPTEWEPSPQADVDIVRETFPANGHGTFPILDMYKVDMTAFNTDKPVPERRQLLLYRLMRPLPKTDVNAHILCHAFEADRNGLLMVGNHLGYGYSMGAVATLSYSFYVHVNANETVMDDEDGDGWWIQEVCWPRVSAGRAMQECRLWSPSGKHVATGYQDGLVLPGGKRREEGKL